jgi:hypothetical protein
VRGREKPGFSGNLEKVRRILIVFFPSGRRLTIVELRDGWDGGISNLRFEI